MSNFFMMKSALACAVDMLENRKPMTPETRQFFTMVLTLNETGTSPVSAAPPAVIPPSPAPSLNASLIEDFVRNNSGSIETQPRPIPSADLTPRVPTSSPAVVEVDASRYPKLLSATRDELGVVYLFADINSAVFAAISAGIAFVESNQKGTGPDRYCTNLYVLSVGSSAKHADSVLLHVVRKQAASAENLRLSSITYPVSLRSARSIISLANGAAQWAARKFPDALSAFRQLTITPEQLNRDEGRGRTAEDDTKDIFDRQT